MDIVEKAKFLFGCNIEREDGNKILRTGIVVFKQENQVKLIILFMQIAERMVTIGPALKGI